MVSVVLVWLTGNRFDGYVLGVVFSGVDELSGNVNALYGGFVRQWVVEFQCVLPVLFAGVDHGYDDAVDKSYEVGVVVLPGVEPL